MPVIIERAVAVLIALAAAVVVLTPIGADEPIILWTQEHQLTDGRTQVNGKVEHFGDEYSFEAIIERAVTQPGRIKKLTIKRDKDSVTVEYEHDAPVTEIKDPTLSQVGKTLLNWLNKYRKTK